MFVKTVDSLDDYTGITASKLDSNSIEGALIEAAKRATRMNNGEMAYVEFVRPPHYDHKVTETIHFDIDLDDYEGLHALEIKSELRRTTVDIIRQNPRFLGAEMGAESVRLIPTGDFKLISDVSEDVTVRFLVKNFSLPGSDIAFGTYEEALASIQRRAHSTHTDVTDARINPYFYNGYGQWLPHASVSTISTSYNAEVTVKMPIADDTPLYIVFGG